MFSKEAQKVSDEMDKPGSTSSDKKRARRGSTVNEQLGVVILTFAVSE
jgi:hypothetical protein